MTDRPPPSLTPPEIIGDDDPPPGLQCPVCHCRHLPVEWTRKRRGRIVRKRRCRHCGHAMMTYERTAGG